MYGKHGKEEILIKMAYLYEVPNITSGIDDILVGTVTAVPSFMPLFLFFIFGVVWVGGILSQYKRSGISDVPFWSVTASVIVFIISLILTLRQGLIQVEVLSVVTIITILTGFWFFIDRNKNEIY